MRLLEVLVDAPQSLTLAEIAAEAGLDQSTAHRLLKALEEAGYVIRGEAGRRYAASPHLLDPLPLLHPIHQLRREAHRIIFDLAQRIVKTVILVVYFGTERMVIEIAVGPGSLTPYYGTWLKGPLHATGVGKALLVGLSREQRDRLLGDGPMERFTERTVCDRGVLERELEESSRRGFVISKGEYRPGVTNVAVPINSWNGVTVGCLNLSGHEEGIDAAECERLGGELMRAVSLLVYEAPSLDAVSRYCRL